jgi:hypothetical protein
MVKKYEKEIKVTTDPMSNEKYVHVDFVNFLLEQIKYTEELVKRMKWLANYDETAKKILKEVNSE